MLAHTFLPQRRVLPTDYVDMLASLCLATNGYTPMARPYTAQTRMPSEPVMAIERTVR